MHWLQAGAPGSETFAEVVTEIGVRLNAAGIPAAQVGVYKTMIHPELPAHLNVWTAAAGTRILTYTPDVFTRSIWLGTPAQICISTGRTQIVTLGQAPEFDAREDMIAHRKRGYIQLVCLPLHSRYAPAINAISIMTKQVGGFDDASLDALNRLQAPIARLTESFILYESTVAVLSTYVGRDAGARVLSGNIRRGGTETIPAIVLFVDVEGFTAISNTRPPTEVVAMLNRFFQIVDSAIQTHGGEILKFIGDGALAVFPTPDNYAARSAAAAEAIAALEDARAALAADEEYGSICFRAALHVGDVHYGNIGSNRRLDFTVIGPTVNMASRLLSVASEIGNDTVCSDDFARLLEVDTRSLGAYTVKGFNEELIVHTLD
jgi:adenylate cyclase